MTKLKLTLLAAAAIGAISISSASAMPLNDVSAAPGASLVQEVRVVCNDYGRCYNTRRARSVRSRAQHNEYYDGRPVYGYYGDRGYGYGGPGVAIGIGPLGIRVR
jgi:hypothetical protein